MKLTIIYLLLEAFFLGSTLERTGTLGKVRKSIKDAFSNLFHKETKIKPTTYYNLDEKYPCIPQY